MSTEDTSGSDSARRETMSGARSRPLLTPKLFTGIGSFGDWVDHFESVAAISGTMPPNCYGLECGWWGELRLLMDAFQQRLCRAKESIEGSVRARQS